MHPLLAVECLAVLMASAGVFFLVVEYVMPDELLTNIGRRVNVPRRHLESLRSWQSRILTADEARFDALMDFTAAARAFGTPGRLPARHPAAVGWLAARYPDGPSLEELLALAGLEERPKVVRKKHLVRVK